MLFAIVALLALTVCGSLWDYEIANALYVGQLPADNFFGILFSFIGIFPTFVGWSFLGAGILRLSKKQTENQTKRRWLYAFAVLLFLLSFFYFCNTLTMANLHAFSVHWAIAYPIGIAILVGAGFLGDWLAKQSENAELLKVVLFLSVVSLVVLLFVSSVKGIMDRPRFYFVREAANEDYFRNWWQTGSAIQASVSSDNLSDAFSSFPSGHSAYSMFAIFLFPALADYIPKLQKHRGVLHLVGFVWWGLTAFSRLTVGAHYLTDVCIAGLLTILSYALVCMLKRILTNTKRGCKNEEKKLV